MNNYLSNFVLGAVCLTTCFYLGVLHERNDNERQRVEEARSAAAEVEKLQTIISTNTENHRKEVEVITNELQQSQNNHAQALADANRRFVERLRSSETRASRYERLSKASDSDRAYLASHAAELDRTLEEGRYVVYQLGESLKQCEREMKSVSDFIYSELKLYEGKQ